MTRITCIAAYCSEIQSIINFEDLEKFFFSLEKFSRQFQEELSRQFEEGFSNCLDNLKRGF